MAIRAFRRRDEIAVRNAIVQAWHTALYQRLKRMPELKQILDRLDRKPPRKKTSAEVIQLFEHMTMQLKGTDLRKKQETVNV